MKLGMTLRQARKYRELTQSDMAKRLGISRDTYIKLERNPDKCTMGMVREISRVLDMPMNEIIFLTP